MKILIVTEQPALNIKHKNPLMKGIENCEGKNKCYRNVIADNEGAFKQCYEKYMDPIPIAFSINYYGQDRVDSILLKLTNTMEYIKKELKKKSKKAAFYWTHYVKCMGKPNFKVVKSVVKDGIDIDQCATYWMMGKKEINAYDPDLIITFGTYASGYLVYGEGDSTFNGIEVCKFNKSQIISKDIFVLPHPAGASVMANDYWRDNKPTPRLEKCLSNMIKELPVS